jgi:hypothetical protein
MQRMQTAGGRSLCRALTLLESSRPSPPHRPREDELAHPADTFKIQTCCCLGSLLSRWIGVGFDFQQRESSRVATPLVVALNYTQDSLRPGSSPLAMALRLSPPQTLTLR